MFYLFYIGGFGLFWGYGTICRVGVGIFCERGQPPALWVLLDMLCVRRVTNRTKPQPKSRTKKNSDTSSHADRHTSNWYKKSTNHILPTTKNPTTTNTCSWSSTHKEQRYVIGSFFKKWSVHHHSVPFYFTCHMCGYQPLMTKPNYTCT